jgi:hypothetical protein
MEIVVFLKLILLIVVVVDLRIKRVRPTREVKRARRHRRAVENRTAANLHQQGRALKFHAVGRIEG